MRQARASQSPDVDLLRLDRRGASDTHMEGCGAPPRTVATTRGDVVGDTALHGGGGDDRDAGRSRRRRGSTRRNSSSVAFRRPQLPVEPMGQEQKGDASSSSGIYTYKHRGDRGVDIHEIFVKKSRTRVLLSYAGVVFLLAIVCQSLLGKEILCLRSVWSITFGVLVAKCLQYKPVMKESVVIMPSFGVQLEIHFWSGAVDRCFIPTGKILKPLLNECLTPVTCYWSLALLLRDEDELKLVFQKFRPPVKMLVPIWKALCAFTDSKCANQPSAVSKPNYSEA